MTKASGSLCLQVWCKRLIRSRSSNSVFAKGDLSDVGFYDSMLNRGSGRSPYPELSDVDTGYPISSRPPGWIDVTKAFLKAAGYRTIQTTVLDQTFYKFIPDQAHVLYISTHGFHASGTVAALDGPFGAQDTDWHKGLSVVGIAGCSVLDVTGAKWANNPAEVNKAPGRKWAATGPCLLLGYEHSAPIDRFVHWNLSFSDTGPKQVVDEWINGMELRFESPLYAWIYANWFYQQSVHKNCHNATAIDACSTPKTAYHLIGNLGGTFLSNFEVRSENQWAGQE